MLPFCIQHLKSELGLRLGPSTIPNTGTGLFALKPFRTGDVIAPYIAETLSKDQVDQYYGEDVAAYTYKLNQKKYLDAACVRGTASYSNTNPHHQNAKIVGNNRNGTAQIVATKTIATGEEIFTAYGIGSSTHFTGETQPTFTTSPRKVKEPTRMIVSEVHPEVKMPPRESKREDRGPKPILFCFENSNFATADIKPLAILAILAAKYARDPIHLLFPSKQPKLLFWEKLAHETIGAHWASRFIVHELTEYSDRKRLKAQSFCIGLDLVREGVDGINLDFGDNDNSQPSMRFVTCILKGFNPDVPHFGGLYLPLDYIWSGDVGYLKHFRGKHTKIVGIAGSRVPPVNLKDLVKWSATSDWACVLLGYKEAIANASENRKVLEWLKSDKVLVIPSYMEFEDLIKFVDFWCSNCGAGSITVALAAGVPQVCGTLGSVGKDKKSNAQDIELFSAKRGLWSQVMANVDKHFDHLKVQSLKARDKIAKETEHMHKNLSRFFNDLGSGLLQYEISSNKLVPAIYSLGEC